VLSAAEKSIRAQFGDDGFASLPAGNPAAALALGGLLSYLLETQKTDLSYIRRLDYYEEGRFMELDLTARRNLELTETLQRREKKGSLLWVLDRTRTPMGGRMLRSWLERPLLSVTAIARRSGAVEALVNNTIAREELIAALSGIGDMERLIGRIVYGTAGGRDLTSLRAAAEKLPAVAEQLKAFSAGRLGELAAGLDTLDDLAAKIAAVLCDEPPFSVREGGFIRDGYSEEVDRLRKILSGGKGFITDIEAREKEKTGIRTLRVGYNKVFGYYLEVSKSFTDKVPDTYIRKQTTVNGERYVTAELKDLEHTILTAADRSSALEYELFSALRGRSPPRRPGCRRRPPPWRSWTPCAPSPRWPSATTTAAPTWTSPASSRSPPAATPWWSGCCRRASSSPTTRLWGRRTAGWPSSRAPTWPANPPTCARWR
jgi:DNA mismatch repair protein MutS